MTNPGENRVIIHAGLRKTGTTTIQATFKENAALIGPDFLISTRDDLTYRLRQKIMLVSRADRPRLLWASTLREMKRFAKNLRKELGGRTAIISDETLCTAIVQNRNGETLLDWTGKILPALESALLAEGLRPNFYLYSRKTDDWLKSAWGQSVKLHGWDMPLDEFLSTVPHGFDIERGISAIQEKMPNSLVHIRMEEELRDAPFLGYAMLKDAGVPETTLNDIVVAKPQNLALPKAALEFLMHANAELKTFPDARHAVSRVVVQNRALFREVEDA